MKCMEAGESAYVDYSHVHQPTNPPGAGHFFHLYHCTKHPEKLDMTKC